MLGWLKQKTVFGGSVHFRGTMPLRAEEFTYLKKRDIGLALGRPRDGCRWTLHLSHPEWGKAMLMCLQDPMLPPRTVVECDRNLTDAEKQAVLAAGSGVQLRREGDRGHVLRDRKLALRFLEAVLGADGVAAADHTSWRFWSPEALREELSHDADLDIEQILSFHAVTADGDAHRVFWLHSHGLGEIGFFDFDVLNPSEDVCSTSGSDLLRAIAFAIVEEHAGISTPRFGLARPGGDIRFVEVSDFARYADPAVVALRTHEGDTQHTRKRAVVCDPAGRLWGRWSRKVRPSRYLSSPVDDSLLLNFSAEASNLMAERARGTYRPFQKVFGELAEFEFPALVKLGFVTDGGKADDKEHLWFEVHEPLDREIDCTLANDPVSVSRLAKGRRGRHAVDLLSDWMIMTPIGNISPRQMTVLRMIRSKREQLRAMMAAYKAGRNR